MSQHVQDLSPVRFRIQRPSVGWMVSLALAVAILTTSTMLIVLNDGGTGPQTSHIVKTSVGGPNEAARGSSVATATGVPSSLPTGGVDESARGSSVAAATSLPTSHGINETARGQAAASASR
jgi:hypothetical protein